MTIDFSAYRWKRVYFQTHQGDPNNTKIYAPLIAPFEIPLLFNRHILAITVICQNVKPKWRTSGYLNQTYSGINLEEAGNISTVNSPSAGVDAASKRIGINVLQLVMFPRLANTFYLWFDPVHWLPKITLSIWEFQGTETDNTQEKIANLEALLLESRANIAMLQGSLDAINYKLDTTTQ